MAELELTTMRTPVSVGPILASAINSYKLGCPGNMPRPFLTVTANGQEPIVFDTPGKYEVPAAEYTIQSSSGGILTNELGVPLTLVPGSSVKQSGNCVVELVPGMKITLEAKEKTHQQSGIPVIIHEGIQAPHNVNHVASHNQNKYQKYRKVEKYHG